MRLLELYDLWERFNEVIENPRLDGSVKQMLGGELMKALPPAVLCGSFSLSRTQIEADMSGRLNGLKERDGRREEAGGGSSSREETSEAPKEVRAKPKHGTKRPGKKSI